MLHIGSNLVNFVRTSVSGDQTPKARSLNPEADRIDRDYGQIQDELHQVNQGLDKLDQETQLKPPSLSHIKNSDLLLMGATAGAALGATVGMLDNVLTSAAREPEVKILETQHDVTRPVLLKPGYTENRVELTKQVPIYNADGSQAGTRPQVTGWHVEYNPSIRNDKIGTYTTREAQVTDNGAQNPILHGLTGAVVGGAIGAGVAGVTVAIRKYLPNGEYQDTGDARETTGDLKVMAKMAGAGAVGGAALGGLSGILAQTHHRVITVESEAPVFKSETLGQVPKDYDISVFSGGSGSPGMRDVTGQVPQTHISITGMKPDVTVSKQTVEVGGNANLAMSILSGAVVGAGAGLAAAVLTNTLRKTL